MVYSNLFSRTLQQYHLYIPFQTKKYVQVSLLLKKCSIGKISNLILYLAKRYLFLFNTTRFKNIWWIWRENWVCWVKIVTLLTPTIPLKHHSSNDPWWVRVLSRQMRWTLPGFNLHPWGSASKLKPLYYAALRKYFVMQLFWDKLLTSNNHWNLFQSLTQYPLKQSLRLRQNGNHSIAGTLD